MSTIGLVTALSFGMLVVCLTGVTFLPVSLAGGLTNTVPLSGWSSKLSPATCLTSATVDFRSTLIAEDKKECLFRELLCDTFSSTS